MTSDRKKPGVAFWATVVLTLVLVGYPLSFGPACWIVEHAPDSASTIIPWYSPLFVVAQTPTASGLLQRYVALWADRIFIEGENIYIGRSS